MKRPATLLLWLIFLGGIINYYITHSHVTREARTQLKDAYVEYVRGETAEAVGKRQEAFNIALSHYTQLEEEYQPTSGNGRI